MYKIGRWVVLPAVPPTKKPRYMSRSSGRHACEQFKILPWDLPEAQRITHACATEFFLTFVTIQSCSDACDFGEQRRAGRGRRRKRGEEEEEEARATEPKTYHKQRRQRPKPTHPSKQRPPQKYHHYAGSFFPQAEPGQSRGDPPKKERRSYEVPHTNKNHNVSNTGSNKQNRAVEKI